VQLTNKKQYTVQASKISEMEKQIQALGKDKAELAKQRDLALKDVEGTGSRNFKNHSHFPAKSLM
jgi:hypothetical protein